MNNLEDKTALFRNTELRRLKTLLKWSNESLQSASWSAARSQIEYMEEVAHRDWLVERIAQIKTMQLLKGESIGTPKSP